MSMYRLVLTAAEMQGRDLLRRHLALLILIALPLVSYLTSYLSHENKGWVFTSGGLGMSWSVAGAAFFLVLGARQVDPRLVLSGFPPLALVLGRLLLLQALALILIGGFSALMVANYGVYDAGILVLGVAFAGSLGVPFGMAVAALVPRELEGMLAIIGLVGIEMSVPSSSPASPFLPVYSGMQLLAVAAGQATGVMPAVFHGLAYGLGLFVLALVLWSRRTGVST